jgi:hypothetical protein
LAENKKRLNNKNNSAYIYANIYNC